MHLASSPVVGSRNPEFNKLSFMTMTTPLLKELERNIYDLQYRLIIPIQFKDKAYQYSKEIFIDYIKKYHSHGITENNIVEWVTSKGDEPALNYCQPQQLSNTKYMEVKVEAENGSKNETSGYYTSPYIVAYHEVMHIEEYNKKLFQPKYGCETIPTIKTIILLDEVVKKIQGKDLGAENDYGKFIKISKKKIPLGTFANFYRLLEREYGNLGDAVLSGESLCFLTGKR